MTEIAQHQAYLFYPFGFPTDSRADVKKNIVDPLLALTVDDLDGLSPPAELRERIAGKPGKTAVWRENELTLRPELHSHLRRLFGAGDPSPGDDFRGRHPLELTPECINVLSGDWGRRGSGLEVEIGGTATKRLGGDDRDGSAGAPIPVRIDSVRLHLFASGVGVVLVQLTYGQRGKKPQPIPPQHLLEANYACTRTGHQVAKLRWVTDASPAFTLLELIDLIAPCARPDTPPESSRRHIQPGSKVFSYTVARFDQRWTDEAEKLAFAFRLGRKYTEAYLPTREVMAAGLYRPFDNVIHAIGLEGGATLVESCDAADEPIPFLRDQFLTQPLPQAYLPLVLLAYQEYCLLLHLAQSVYRPIRHGVFSPQDREALERYQADLLDYRLNQRFSHASRVETHNHFYNAWRQALSLDALLTEVTRDVNEVTKYLNYKLEQELTRQEREYQRKWEVYNRFYGYIGILFALLVLFVGAFGMNLDEITMSWSDIRFLSAGLALAGVAGVLVLSRWWLDRRLKRK